MPVKLFLFAHDEIDFFFNQYLSIANILYIDMKNSLVRRTEIILTQSSRRANKFYSSSSVQSLLDVSCRSTKFYQASIVYRR